MDLSIFPIFRIQHLSREGCRRRDQRVNTSERCLGNNAELTPATEIPAPRIIAVRRCFPAATGGIDLTRAANRQGPTYKHALVVNHICHHKICEMFLIITCEGGIGPAGAYSAHRESRTKTTMVTCRNNVKCQSVYV